MSQLLLLAIVFLSVLLGISLGAVLLRGFLALVAWMIPVRGPAEESGAVRRWVLRGEFKAR